VLGLLSGKTETTKQEDTLLASLPKDLVSAYIESLGAATGLREAEDLLDDVALAELTQSTAERQQALGPKIKELYAAIDALSTKTQQSQEPTGSLVSNDNNQATQPNSIEPDKTVPPVSTETVVPVTQTTEESVASEETTEAPRAAGSISTASVRSPEGTSYELKNLLADYVKQSAGDKEGTNRRPLVAVKDFMSSVYNKTVPLTDFLDTKLSDAQREAVHGFFKTAKAWQTKLRQALPAVEKLKYFHYQDMMQFMLREDGSIDENVEIAISYAAFGWLGEAATKPRLLTKDNANALRGRKKGEYFPRREYEMVNEFVGYRHTIIDSLGQRVMDALGMKSLPDTPQDLMPRLQTALGMHALKVLEDQGLIINKTLSGTEVRDIREAGLPDWKIEKFREKNPTNTSLPHEFYKLPWIQNKESKKFELTPGVQAILNMNKGTQDILSKLFGVTSGIKFPSFSPITKGQKTAKGSKQGVPQEIEKTVLKNQAHARRVRRDLVTMFGMFNDNDIDAMIGVIPVTDERVHVNNRKSLEAKNDGLRREYALFQEFVQDHLAMQDKGLDTDFFLEFSVWVQQRVGVATNGVNPQTSKIVRHLIGSPSWESEIDSTNMDGFFLRVAEGLGVKTERADNSVSVVEVKETLKDPVYTAGIAALRKALVAEQELTPEEQANVRDAVLKGGANMHSLDALSAVAYQQAAAETANGQPYKFKSQLMGEVDGVANGTMLNHMLFGAKGTPEELQTFMDKGGFFAKDGKYTQYNQYRGTLGNLDIYEGIAHTLHVKAQSFMKTASTEMAGQMASIWAIAGDIVKNQKVTKAGRLVIKDATNPLSFGAGMAKVKQGMADAFMDTVYGGFEKLAAQKLDSETPPTQAQIDAYVDHVNSLIPDYAKKFRIPAGRPIEFYMNDTLASIAEKGIMDTYMNTVGAVIEEVMSAEFAVFLTRRDTFNEGARDTYFLYEAVYKGEREAFIAELIAKKEIPVNDKKRPIADLTKLQEQELEKRLKGIAPIIRTASSKRDVKPDGSPATGRASGLLMAKQEHKQNADPVYTNKTKFSTPLQNGKSSANLRGQATIMSDPSVAMASAETHSTDSAISHMTQWVMDVLNIHDANGAGINQMEDVAKLLNKHTWEYLVEHSPLAEVYQSQSVVIRGVARMLRDGKMSPQAQANLRKLLESKNAILASLIKLKRSAYQADKTKLEMMVKLGFVDQYAFQGGNFKVTEKDTAYAQKLLDGLTEDITANELEAINFIGEALFSETGAKVVAKPVAAPAPVEAVDTAVTEEGEIDEGAEDEAPVPTTSVFGLLGKPVIKSNDGLVRYFKQNPKAPAKAVLKMLADRLTNKYKLATVEGKRDLQMEMYVLNRVLNSIGEDVQVVYVTPSTPADQVKGRPEGPSRGWFSFNESGSIQEIYVLSDEFVDSGLTDELLRHELTHATLARLIKEGKPEVQPFIAELEQLLKNARIYVKSLSVQDQNKFAPALKDVQEFVAWGMTSRYFQTEVLNNITTTPKTKKLDLVKGMKRFIDALVGILFAGSDKSNAEIGRNGMTIMINNATALFAQAAQNKGTPTEGSTDVNTLSMALPSNTYSTMDVLEALGGLSVNPVNPVFKQHLQELLGEVVDSLYGPWGSFKEALMKNTALSPMGVFMQAMSTGVAPFASEVLASPWVISAQEAFVVEQVEATVQAALKDPALSAQVYKELSKLYTEARQTIKVSDFHGPNATQTEKDVAQKQYDFVFNPPESITHRSAYLARFAALGLAHQGFNQKLKFNTLVQSKRVQDGKTIADKVQIVFEKILAYFSEKVLKTYKGQPADEKLLTLVRHVATAEAKRLYDLDRQANEKSLMDPLAEGIGKFAQDVKDKAVDVASSNMFKNSSRGVVRGVSGALRILAEDHVDTDMAALQDMRDKQTKGQLGLAANLLTQLRGHPKKFLELLRLAKRDSESRRKTIITQTAKFALETFKDKGENLTDTAKAGITAVFMRTGLFNLVDKFTLAEIETFVSDDKALDGAITTYENQLLNFGSAQNYFIKQAKGLGFYKSTGGIVVAQGQLMNAHAIAHEIESGTPSKLTALQRVKATATLKVLISLYALRYADSAHRDQAKEVMRTENNRTDGNGIEYVMRQHKAFEKDSLVRLFHGNPALMMHGYTPEIYNPYTEVVTANFEEGKALMDLGYKKSHALPRDPSDPDTEVQHFYVLKDGGLNPHTTGSVNYSSQQGKGSQIHSGRHTPNNAFLQAMINSRKRSTSGELYLPDPTWDPVKVGKRYMAPVINEAGEFANWRYLMHESTKDDVLQRNSRFDQVMGVYAGSIYDKANVRDQNKTVFEALKEQYDTDFAIKSDAYLMVGPDSPDPQLREIWNLLPPESRADARRIFGRDAIWIHNQALDIVFGYRKISLADSFKSANKERDRNKLLGLPTDIQSLESINQIEKLMVGLLEWALTSYARTGLGKTEEEAERYARKAAVLVTKSERGWQTLVGMAKDNIVVKSYVVMQDNILSNVSMLVLSGVPIKDIVKHHLIALRAATQHRKDSEELLRLEQRFEAGYTQGEDKDIQQSIARLKDSLARNPVSALINEGLMPTIVEDLAADDESDPYAYKSILNRKLEEMTDRLPGALKTVGKTVLMTHDTMAYQGLSRITQLSDFVARYTLYQHNVTKKNPMSHSEAIQDASEAFVNYDVPLHRTHQFLEDMGLIMFSKYALHIQRVLIKLAKEHPARVFSTILLGNFVSLGPIVLDGSAFNRFGNNPITSGAFKYLGTLDDLATVRSALSLVK